MRGKSDTTDLMARMLDLIQKVQRGELPPPPVATLIGFTLTAVESGRAVLELVADGRHANPMGTVHGGIRCDVADAAMGMAYASTLDEGESSPDVVDEKDRLVARAASTCMTLRGDEAKGR